MLCSPRFQIEGNSRKERGLKSLHPSASGYAVIREDDHMTRYRLLEEENLRPKRSRYNSAEREEKGVVQESYENVSAAVQSDSMLKVSSGDSEITAEQMAERSSGITSSSDGYDNNNGCTLKLDLAQSCRTEASEAAINQQLYTVTEKFHETFSDSGLHKSNVEDSQAMNRSERFCSPLRQPVSGKDEDWLALGLGCGHASGQSKHLSNKPHLEMAKDANASIITSIEDKIKNDHLPLLSHTFNAGHKSKLTTQLPPSSSTIQARLFSFPNICNSISPPLPKADKFSLQKNTSDSSSFSALSPLQHYTMQDQQRSQNIAVFPSIKQLYLNLQGQASGVRPWQSKQAAYDRISEVRLCEPRIAASTHGIHRFSPGQKTFNSTTVSALPRQNSDIRAPATGLLQQTIREKMQYNGLDNFPSWTNQEITSTKISPPHRTPPFRPQQYSLSALLSDRNMAQGPSSQSHRVLDSSWKENVKILKPRTAAQTSVWFALHALKDQNGDRMLPQIQKNYLRIKDGTMTVLVLKKYLVNKLGLNSESEIEIMCKGEHLLPSLTLQYVRDVMWLPSFRNDDDEISSYSSNAHLMVLHYQRNRSQPAATTQFQPR
ncbi:uncharacterized protein LOC131068191 isoform X2 [Cryptomeria japonica]|nr:uncharacterized protein LOC131068191 isoform X2 [Cryptomeria japonica]XP_057859364.2 uncharacterized protein LOC131068191 isoform X2 [Cryptomeria japonica]